MSVVMVIMLSVGFVSCDGDDSGGSSLRGWYTDLSYVATQSDFNVINAAINNHEVLSSYRYGGQTHTYVASRDLFINSDGMYNDVEPYLGRLRFSISNPINAIRIVDDSTLLFYVGWLYEDGKGDGDTVYRLYAGSIFGNMAYCGSPLYYSYIRTDNMIIVSNGDIYTIVDGGLVKNGSSSPWSKYDPNRVN